MSSASALRPGRSAGAIRAGSSSHGRSASILRTLSAQPGNTPGMRLLRLVALLVLLIPGTAFAAAPGAPGKKALWTEADKDGFGTATGTTSKVWHTLDDGELTEVYYPDIATPALRDLQFVVSDGRRFAERERQSAGHATGLTDPRSLTFRQTSTTRRYRIVKTYVTDPRRNALVVDVRFVSRTGKRLKLFVLADPALSNDGGDDRSRSVRRALVARDKR